MNELPEGWVERRLGELVQLVRGVTFKKEEARSTPAAGFVPIIRAGNIQSATLDLHDDLVYVPRSRVKDVQLLQLGDIVIASSSGSSSVVGKSARVLQPWNGAHGAFLTVARPLGIDPAYLGYWLQGVEVRRQWSAASAGTNINNLKSSVLLETQVPVAPVAEQLRIVAAIEEHLSGLSAAEVSIAQAAARATGLRTALLAAAFRGQLVPLDLLASPVSDAAQSFSQLDSPKEDEHE